ncbi:hypothetical protein OKW45_005746 [Paraburkholderia sp. WSM4175]
MRATTAIPPTNHAHSAARTPDPRSFARHPRPQHPPARASGRTPERHKPCCPPVERKTRSPTCCTCRITLPFPRRPGRCTLIGPNRSSPPLHRPSRRRTRPSPTRSPARHPIRSNPSNQSRRRSAIRRRSQRKRLRPPTACRDHGNVDTTSMSALCCALDAPGHALERCSALLYLLQSRRMFYRQFTVSPPRL